MIAVLFIVLAGYALIFGAGNFAERALRTAVGLALIISAFPGLLAALERWVSRLRLGGDAPFAASLGDALAVLALAGVGLFAWRARGFFARRRQERAQAWSGARERALPPPPPDDAPGAEGGA